MRILSITICVVCLGSPIIAQAADGGTGESPLSSDIPSAVRIKPDPVVSVTDLRKIGGATLPDTVNPPDHPGLRDRFTNPFPGRSGGAAGNMPSLADLPDSGSPKVGSSGDKGKSLEEFHQVDEDPWLKKLIHLRKEVILDTLRQRRHALEKGLGHRSRSTSRSRRSREKSNPPKKEQKRVVYLGHIGDKAVLVMDGKKHLVPIGSRFGGFTVASLTSGKVDLKDNSGKELVVKKGSVPPKAPDIRVIAMNGFNATIEYQHQTYSVSENSNLGNGLSVTRVSPNGIEVRDAHGHAFKYSAPQAGRGPFGYPGYQQPVPFGTIPPPGAGSRSTQQQPEEESY